MTRRIIFNGQVNGRKFSNVEEYNKAVQEALATGVELNCSSETKTVDEPDVNMLPFVTEEKMGYLQELSSEDFMNKVDEAFDKVEANLDKVADVDSYADKLSETLDVLDRDANEIEDTIEKLEKQIELLERGLNVSEYLGYRYQQLLDSINGEDLEDLDEEDPQDEAKPNPKGDVRSEPEYNKGILRLLSEILGSK